MTLIIGQNKQSRDSSDQIINKNKNTSLLPLGILCCVEYFVEFYYLCLQLVCEIYVCRQQALAFGHPLLTHTLKSVKWHTTNK